MANPELAEICQRIAVLEERTVNQSRQLEEISQNLASLREEVVNHLVHRLPYSITIIISVLSMLVGVLGTLLASRW
jgi:hypothetical protein